MNLKEEALGLHEKWKGKIQVTSKVPVANKYDLSMAYTPGVAEPCKEIHRDKTRVYDYTGKGNLVAIVTDGSAVLGLGDIGPEAALPVMEGKAVLFKAFGDVDGFPICIPSQEVETIVQTVKMIAPGFGGINLEDISAPRCVEIEARLKKELDIPVFHDDQHGTAIVVVAGLINALKIVKKEFSKIKVTLLGGGAAGNAIVNMLLTMGVKNIVVCDKEGILKVGNQFENPLHQVLAENTNPEGLEGDLSVAMKDADVFIGVSRKDLVSEAMVSSMAKDSIVFAMANPDPEIMPELAKKAGARIVGTGRSDFPNQINNVLAFPGIFRGALDARASDINEAMKKAAALAIAEMVTAEELSESYIIPPAFQKGVAEHVAEKVFLAAKETQVARI